MTSQGSGRAKRIRAALAAQPASAVIEASDDLTIRLIEEGLFAPRSTYETIALIRNLSMAGRRADEQRWQVERVRPQPGLRDQLETHLRYWTAVNRVRTRRRRHMEVDAPFARLEEHQPYASDEFPTVEPRRFFREASEGDGVSHSQVTGFKPTDLPSSFDQLLALNCRLILGQLKLSLHERHVWFNLSLLVGVDLDLADLEVFDGSHFAVVGGRVVCQASEVKLVNSAFRYTEVTIKSPKANLSKSDCAFNSKRDRSDLLDFAETFGIGVDEKKRNDPAVRFVGCKVPGASFDGSALQGAVFERCDMPEATFSEASVAGARFIDCTLAGVDFTRALDSPEAILDDASRVGAKLK